MPPDYRIQAVETVMPAAQPERFAVYGYRLAHVLSHGRPPLKARQRLLLAGLMATVRR